nr:hypothetical protein DGKKSRWO_DGKKSRWO_CDS_0146 [uncultured phage]CAI9751438.1 hypothetical protein DGKKSRWO_DGKKSRWO_CDS_0147 [uncultured phage]CAI9752323.1 hypothetical protein CVNMHQAP_CVNMHQAP_CDS_0146 [uncultured phage]CAI9752324.1 hypothetical protein CVNMHQAP_CVNMHQAP_CDS_0147 [uncultured phage]
MMVPFDKLITYFGKKYRVDGKMYTLLCTMPVSRDLVLEDEKGSRYQISLKDFNLDAYC